jgi:hypothetical protein
MPGRLAAPRDEARMCSTGMFNLREHVDHTFTGVCGRLEEQMPSIFCVGLCLLSGNLTEVLSFGAGGGVLTVWLIFRLGGRAGGCRLRRLYEVDLAACEGDDDIRMGQILSPMSWPFRESRPS